MSVPACHERPRPSGEPPLSWEPPPGFVRRVDRVNGARLHHVACGDPAGPVVLLLHGFPESWWCWRHQLAPLAAAGFRVIALDQRGHGRSERSGPYDLETVTTDAVALLDRLGAARAHVVGHDWGGIVAWHLAATRPARLGRLAIVNAPHPTVFRRALLRRPRQLLRSAYVFFFQLPWLPEKLLLRERGHALVRRLRRLAADPRRLPRAALEPYRRALLRPGAAGAMLGWYRAAARSLLQTRALPAALAPTRIIWGLDDPTLGFRDVVPGTGRHAPRLDVRLLPGCGHFAPEEAPERVTPLLLEHLGAPVLS